MFFISSALFSTVFRSVLRRTDLLHALVLHFKPFQDAGQGRADCVGDSLHPKVFEFVVFVLLAPRIRPIVHKFGNVVVHVILKDTLVHFHSFKLLPALRNRFHGTYLNQLPHGGLGGLIGGKVVREQLGLRELALDALRERPNLLVLQPSVDERLVPHEQRQAEAIEANPEVLVAVPLAGQNLLVKGGLGVENLGEAMVVKERLPVQVPKLFKQWNSFFPTLKESD